MNFNHFFSFSLIIKCNKCLRTLLTHLDSRMQHLMMTLRKIATKCDVSPTSCQMKTLLPQHRTPSKGRKASSRPFATRGLPVFQVKTWHVIDYKKTKLKRLAVSQKMGNRRSKKSLTIGLAISYIKGFAYFTRVQRANIVAVFNCSTK